MIREGREVQYRTDYILGTDYRLFENVSIQDPRHHSDHYTVLGCLHSAHLREHARYLGGRKRLPLLPSTAPTREDGIFAALRRAVPKPLDKEVRKKAWILAATWRLVDKRVSCAKILQRIRCSFGSWDAPLRRACGTTGNGGQRRRDRRWKH